MDNEDVLRLYSKLDFAYQVIKAQQTPIDERSLDFGNMAKGSENGDFLSSLFFELTFASKKIKQILSILSDVASLIVMEKKAGIKSLFTDSSERQIVRDKSEIPFGLIADKIERASSKLDHVIDSVTKTILLEPGKEKLIDGTLAFTMIQVEIIRQLNDGRQLLQGILTSIWQAQNITERSFLNLPDVDWTFISDADFRKLIARDYEELKILLRNKNFKSFIVLTGSLTEALLFVAISKDLGNATNAYQKRYPNKGKSASKSPERWRLVEMIRISTDIGLLDEDAGRHADIVRDFRNLIHPNAEIRKKTSYDQQVVEIHVALLKRILKLLSKSP